MEAGLADRSVEQVGELAIALCKSQVNQLIQSLFDAATSSLRGFWGDFTGALKEF